MSKIGGINLDLQEQANELGFSTVQEALDNGYTCIFNMDGEFRLVKKLDKELEDAHKAWLSERDTIIAKLEMVANAGADTPKDVLRQVAKEAIEFIKKGAV